MHTLLKIEILSMNLYIMALLPLNFLTKYCNNINYIKKKYPEFFKDKVNFLSVFHDKSHHKNINEYFNNYFNKNTTFSELNPLLNDSLLKIYKNILENVEYNKLLEDGDLKVLPDLKSKIAFLSLLSKCRYESYHDLSVDIKYKKFLPTGACLPFSNKIFITANGKILPCETIPHKYSLGEIKKDVVSLDFSEISDLYNCYYQKVIEQCSICYNYINCKVCIFIDIRENNKCPKFLNSFLFANYLTKNIEFFENHPVQYSNLINNIYNG